MVKKYKLKCFGCGLQFRDKTEVHRHNSKPYCDCCYGEILQDMAFADREEYEMEKWHRENPGVDYEQYQIDQANINKYGEC